MPENPAPMTTASKSGAAPEPFSAISSLPVTCFRSARGRPTLARSRTLAGGSASGFEQCHCRSTGQGCTDKRERSAHAKDRPGPPGSERNGPSRRVRPGDPRSIFQRCREVADGRNTRGRDKWNHILDLGSCPTCSCTRAPRCVRSSRSFHERRHFAEQGHGRIHGGGSSYDRVPSRHGRHEGRPWRTKLAGHHAFSWSPIGRLRMRLPVAAKIALHSAGMNGGSPGSPTPLACTSNGCGTM